MSVFGLSSCFQLQRYVEVNEGETRGTTCSLVVQLTRSRDPKTTEGIWIVIRTVRPGFPHARDAPLIGISCLDIPLSNCYYFRIHSNYLLYFNSNTNEVYLSLLQPLYCQKLHWLLLKNTHYFQVHIIFMECKFI